MAEVLLINVADIKALKPLGGNVDSDKIVPYIKAAQDTDLVAIIGEALLDKLKADIDASGLTGNYLTLVNTYIKPCLAFYTMVNYITFNTYQVKNAGTFKHSAEESETIDIRELNMLTQRLQDKAEAYGRKIVRYLCANSSDFPEYGDEDSHQQPPSSSEVFHGWNLD